MKKKIILTVLALCGSIFFTPNKSFAQEGNFNYAVVNMRDVISSSKAIQSISKQINGYKDTLDKQAKVTQDQLQQNQQELLKKQPQLSPDAFEKAKKEFQEKVQKIQQDFYDKSQKLDQSRQTAMLSLEKSINDIVSAIAKSKNYEVVFQGEALINYPNNKDISKDVISKLNTSTPSINVKKPF